MFVDISRMSELVFLFDVIPFKMSSDPESCDDFFALIAATCSFGSFFAKVTHLPTIIFFLASASDFLRAVSNWADVIPVLPLAFSILTFS